MNKAHPILFSAPMVRAILALEKSVTRRVVKPQPPESILYDPEMGYEGFIQELGEYRSEPCWIYGAHWGTQPRPEVPVPTCPYGGPGDTLWVRETFAIHQKGSLTPYKGKVPEVPTPEFWERYDLLYRATAKIDPDFPIFWRPSIFIRRWASRITLRVVSVRVERLQDITEEDAIREGCSFDGRYYLGGLHAIKPSRKVFANATLAFGDIWDSINGKKYPWASSPWVWRVEFERVEGGLRP